MSRGFLHHQLLLAAASAAVVAIAAPATAQSLDHRLSFNIPDQPVADALVAFSRQSRVQVVSAGAALGAIRAHAVQGSLTGREALTQLLSGTGLTWREVGAGSIIVEAAARADATTVPEVVVTANKRTERAEDVPASVSAVSGGTLRAIGANGLQDYAGKIPGLVVTDVSFANGSTQLSIRGVTTGFGGNPTVGIYIDDAPFGGSILGGGYNIPDFDPSDLQQVEVLRGPQGTLYGAGSIGGLLKYVTAAPDFTSFHGRMEADGWAADHGGLGWGLRGAANIPLSDDVALRVSAYDRQDPGFVTNVGTGDKNLNAPRFDGGRASLAWRVDNDWTVRLSAMTQHETATGQAIVDYNPVTHRPIYGWRKQLRAPGTGDTGQTANAFDLDVEGHLGWATLTSTTSYSTEDYGSDLDATSLLGPLLAGVFGVPGAGAALQTDSHGKKFTQEVRLASPETDRFSWLVGGFYTRETNTFDEVSRTYDATTGDPLSVALPPLVNLHLTPRFQEAAVFADATYRFTDRFDVTAGLRYSRNTQNFTQTESGVLVGPASTVIATSSDESVTYLLTPRYHLSDNTMLYLRLASGYRPGGPNPTSNAGAPATFAPDHVVDYEAGLKTELFDRRLSLDLAAYWIDWKDIQLQEVLPSGVSFIGNAGAATSKGFEASFSWRPIEHLEIDGNVSHTIATLGVDLPASGAAGVGVAGEALPVTARWAGALSADYSFPISGPWTGIVGASFNHVGERPGGFPQPGLPRFVLPAYDVFDLRAGVRNESWTLTAYAKNLGDAHGLLGDSTLGSVTRVSVIQPRTFGLTLAKTF